MAVTVQSVTYHQLNIVFRFFVIPAPTVPIFLYIQTSKKNCCFFTAGAIVNTITATETCTLSFLLIYFLFDFNHFSYTLISYVASLDFVVYFSVYYHLQTVSLLLFFLVDLWHQPCVLVISAIFLFFISLFSSLPLLFTDHPTPPMLSSILKINVWKCAPA